MNGVLGAFNRQVLERWVATYQSRPAEPLGTAQRSAIAQALGW